MIFILANLKYLFYVLRHKWFVFIECCKMGIFWRGLVHDISKFYPSEWFPYMRYFYGNYLEWSKMPAGMKSQYFGPTRESIKKDFDFAWLLHQKRNRHHWQWWLLQEDSPTSEFILQEPGQGYEIYLSRNNRPLAMFDESILFKEDRVKPNFCNDNACMYATEIRDRLNQKPKAIPMPDAFRKEMLADWRGAGRAITGKDNTNEWYRENKNKMVLHPETRVWIEQQLKV